MDNTIFTLNNAILENCLKIAGEFKALVNQNRESLNCSEEDLADEWGISDDEIKSLFVLLKNAMGLNCTLDFFRDNDEEYGRYCESTNKVLLPHCICYYPANEIIEHMAHELYHAFQYSVICNPTNYPDIDNETIKKWDYEFKNYISATKDLQQYLGQDIEKTARAFGKYLNGKR